MTTSAKVDEVRYYVRSDGRFRRLSCIHWRERPGWDAGFKAAPAVWLGSSPSASFEILAQPIIRDLIGHRFAVALNDAAAPAPAPVAADAAAGFTGTFSLFG
jgi:hypothetical protein